MNDKELKQIRAGMKRGIPKRDLPEPSNEELLDDVSGEVAAFRVGARLPIPTRRDMDLMYAGTLTRQLFARMSELVSLATEDPERLDYFARQMCGRKSPSFVRAFDQIASAIGVSRKEVDDNYWGYSAKLLDFSEDKLDPALTEIERKYFIGLAKILQHSKAKGYLTSTPETAPPDSKWAQAVIAKDFGTDKDGSGRGA